MFYTVHWICGNLLQRNRKWIHLPLASSLTSVLEYKPPICEVQLLLMLKIVYWLGITVTYVRVTVIPSQYTILLDTIERLHFHFSLSCMEKEMATHSSVLAWRIPGTGEPGGLPSMGSHRVGHNWSDLAAAACQSRNVFPSGLWSSKSNQWKLQFNQWLVVNTGTKSTETCNSVTGILKHGFHSNIVYQ